MMNAVETVDLLENNEEWDQQVGAEEEEEA